MSFSNALIEYSTVQSIVPIMVSLATISAIADATAIYDALANPIHNASTCPWYQNLESNISWEIVGYLSKRWNYCETRIDSKKVAKERQKDQKSILIGRASIKFVTNAVLRTMCTREILNDTIASIMVKTLMIMMISPNLENDQKFRILLSKLMTRILKWLKQSMSVRSLFWRRMHLKMMIYCLRY